MVKAIVLAAGKGERLWPLTTTRPKPLLPILCKPLLQHHLEVLSRIGVKEAVVVVHHMGEQVEDFLKKITPALGIRATVVRQGSPLGTGHAVKKALEALEEDNNEQLLVVYGDLYVRRGCYEEMLRRLANAEENVIIGATVEDASRYGLLVVENGFLKDLIEKPSEAREGLVNAGIYVLQRKSLERELVELKLSPRGEYELTDAIKALARKERVYVATLPRGCWRDVGTPWDYLEANIDALREECTLRGVPPEKCIIGIEHARIHEPVVIEGPCYICEDVEIGPMSHIRPWTIVCRGAKIGFATQVKASVILEGAKLPHLNYVGDSIVGEHANLGAGTITANLRHDNKPVKTVVKGNLVSTGRRKFGSVIGGYAKTGINTSIMPGVKIGAHAWIGGGCIVDRDVPDYCLLKCSQEKTIIERKE